MSQLYPRKSLQVRKRYRLFEQRLYHRKIIKTAAEANPLVQHHSLANRKLPQDLFLPLSKCPLMFSLPKDQVDVLLGFSVMNNFTHTHP